MDFTAKLVQIMPPRTGEGSNGSWKSQDYIFETDGQYPKKICVSVWNDKGINPSDMQVGNVLNVAFDIESREFNGKWYTNLRSWRIQSASMGGVQGAPAANFNASAGTTMTPNFPAASAASGDDDLPF